MSAKSRAVVAASVSLTPLLLAAAAVAVVIGALVGAHLVWQEAALTLPEAAALNDRGTILRLLQSGADVNAPAPIRPGVVNDDRIVATPLQASVATRTPTTMVFLLARGARMSGPEQVVVACTAVKIEAEEILGYLRSRTGSGSLEPLDCAGIVTPW